MKQIRRFGALFALAATLALSGCALLPEEEVLPEAPVQRTGAQEAFTLDYVQRGDLVRTERYTATYRAVRQEQLCFAVSGVPFDEMYVSEGETVRSGQLLAKLDTGTFEEEAASQAAQIETLALEVRQQEENRALAQEKWEIEWSYMDEEAREDAAPLSEVLRPYDRAIEDLQGQIEVARVRQAQTEAYVRERQLRAGISGVVTYARSLEKGTLSDETEVVFTISDAGSSLFVLSTKDLENFPEGRTVEVVIGLEKQVYPCTVVGVQAAGVREVRARAAEFERAVIHHLHEGLDVLVQVLLVQVLRHVLDHVEAVAQVDQSQRVGHVRVDQEGLNLLRIVGRSLAAHALHLPYAQ